MKEIEMLSEFIADHSRTLPVILAVEEEDSERQININRLAETIALTLTYFFLAKGNSDDGGKIRLYDRGTDRCCMGDISKR